MYIHDNNNNTYVFQNEICLFKNRVALGQFQKRKKKFLKWFQDLTLRGQQQNLCVLNTLYSLDGITVKRSKG